MNYNMVEGLMCIVTGLTLGGITLYAMHSKHKAKMNRFNISIGLAIGVGLTAVGLFIVFIKESGSPSKPSGDIITTAILVITSIAIFVSQFVSYLKRK